MVETDSLLGHQGAWWHHCLLTRTKRNVPICQVILTMTTYPSIHPFPKGLEGLRRTHNINQFQRKSKSRHRVIRSRRRRPGRESVNTEAIWTYTATVLNGKLAPGFDASSNENGNNFGYKARLSLQRKYTECLGEGTRRCGRWNNTRLAVPCVTLVQRRCRKSLQP